MPKGVDVNEDYVPLDSQVPQGRQADQVTTKEFRYTITMLAQFIVCPKIPTPASRVIDFARKNLLEFHGSKVDENPHEFIGGVYKVVMIMGVSFEEKAELAPYKP